LTQFLLALAVFLALLMVPAIPALRARLVTWLGRHNYLLAYSLVSLLALGWLFYATLRLDYIPLWDAAPWQAWFPLVLTPLGFVLLFAGLISPNPTISLRKPDLAPGAITTVTRHPVLWGFAFWAGGHLVPNGDLRSLLLFGSLLVFALAGTAITDRRSRRRLGADWPAIAGSTSVLPFAAALSGRTRLRLDSALIAAILISAAITIWLLLGGHAVLFGADPLALVQAG
jgi:uncharacterized membrane protein